MEGVVGHPHLAAAPVERPQHERVGDGGRRGAAVVQQALVLDDGAVDLAGARPQRVAQLHVVAEDPDKDKMRYRFRLVRLGQSKPKPVQETPWSENPFWSLDTTHLATGDYRVQVDVDDVLSNGRERAKQDTDATLPFAVSHRNPTILREGNGLKSGKVHFQVKGHKAQLVEAMCRLGDAWLPVMPKDGILDDSEEQFAVDVAGQMALTCRFSDEAGNSTHTFFLFRFFVVLSKFPLLS